MLLQDRDERRGPAEGICDHAAIAINAGGCPQLTADLGDEDAALQRALRIEGRQTSQGHIVVGVGRPDREGETVVQWGRVALVLLTLVRFV